MEGIVINPIVLYVLVIVLIVAAISSTILFFKRRGRKDEPYDMVDKVLVALGLPLVLIGVVVAATALAQGNRGTSRREGDDDLAPDTPTEPPAESRGEQVVRIIEDRAEEVEDHVLNDATDDEVAARGAGLFDPGAPPDTEE